MKRIEAVIFDWAGTTVDYGCMAPMHAMQKAFAQQDINVTMEEIRKPMGMLKIDHIKAVLHGKEHNDKDIKKIYDCFEENIFAVLSNHADVIDGVLPITDYLRDLDIKIGSTTGYTKSMLEIVAQGAKQQGYEPDHFVSADQVSKGRPYPYMLHQNMAALGIQNIHHVIKVGDTELDILEGVHAGCWSIGVIKGSSMLGLNAQEIGTYSKEALERKMRDVKYAMYAVGAHYVIDSISELPKVMNLIQHKLSQ